MVKKQSTPLLCACQNEAPIEVIRLLIEEGANVNARDFVSLDLFLDHVIRHSLALTERKTRGTALHAECFNGPRARPEVVRLLIREGAVVNAINDVSYAYSR
jgi:ankyrin repeat protein